MTRVYIDNINANKDLLEKVARLLYGKDEKWKHKFYKHGCLSFCTKCNTHWKYKDTAPCIPDPLDMSDWDLAGALLKVLNNGQYLTACANLYDRLSVPDDKLKAADIINAALRAAGVKT